jgi:Animal haem peroxidase
MGFSEVPRIELSQDGTVTIFVSVGGFRVGTPVEISGYATQANGAIATFQDVQLMPEWDPVEGVPLVVKCVPVIGSTFAPNEPITVVARAADVWITTLDLDTGKKPLSKDLMAAKARARQVSIQAAWRSDEKNYHSVYSPASSPEESPPAAPRSQSSETLSGTTLTRHGAWWDRRKTDRLDVVMGGRFTRLFPYLPGARFDHKDLESLADAMVAPLEESEPEGQDDPEENMGIPAAYTYLGQFTDHDLTFDPISHLRETLTRARLRALVDFRTPRFDLDNLYGRGPDDQPYMYKKDGIRMLLGERMSKTPFDPRPVQLPRGPSGRALIGDPRNDENRIVAQLHAIFLRFHNRVVHQLRKTNKHVSFQEARDQVRWHYQWVLVKDFLPAILDKRTYDSVFPDPFSFVMTIPRLQEDDLELMPVEFSVAAYRFGHSMIRPRYKLNPEIEQQPIFSHDPGDDAVDLGGFRPIPANWAIDWQLFTDLGHDGGPAPQLSYKIDTSLAHPLGHLPDRIARNPSSLALRNLQRGADFQLPSGQQVAAALGIPPIPDDELMIGPATVDGKRKPITEVAPGLAGNAPLWAYILSEAQVMSWRSASGRVSDKTPIRLGPVGGRLVAEVFASLLHGDRTSYLYAKPKFEPIPDFTRDGTFGLAQLINVVLSRAS